VLEECIKLLGELFVLRQGAQVELLALRGCEAILGFDHDEGIHLSYVFDLMRYLES
jgi:hypothetical protein